jgi:hypothetical protein
MTRRITRLAACGLAVLAAVLGWPASRGPGESAPPADSRRAAPAAAPRVADPRSVPPPAAGLPRPQLSPYADGSNEHEAWVDAKADELVKLSWGDDRDSLKRILAELENPEQEIRKAALQATANFGSRDAIPYLESLVATTADAEEKIALIQTAEQLKMPTASEYFAQKKAASNTE